MKLDKCKNCKYYSEGLDGWYVPSCWCGLNNFDDAENCEHYKDKYTMSDYIFDILPNIIFIGAIAFFMWLLSVAHL